MENLTGETVELSLMEQEQVNGGAIFIPVIMWAVKTTAVRLAAKGAVTAGAAYLGYQTVKNIKN